MSQLPEDLRSKLEELDLAEYWEVLRRNLKAVLLRPQAGPGQERSVCDGEPVVGGELRPG